jgi:hypothetical protein
MLANLDLLLTTVFCPADALPPERAKNVRKRFGSRLLRGRRVAGTSLDVSCKGPRHCG